MPGWFQALMPKEEKFFDLFSRHATVVVAGADALRSLLRGGEAGVDAEANRKLMANHHMQVVGPPLE
jgi:hypothetical protein